ncbi:MAG TPA: DUF4912 domain-containing protein [Chthoniobacterales bacterium]
MKPSAQKRPAKHQEKGAFEFAPKLDTPSSNAARSAASKKSVAAPPPKTTGHAPALPRTYGFETLFLIAQDPHWLFTYWDIDISRHPGGQTFLRCYHGNKEIEKEIEVPFETRNWYIPVTVAGARYHVELGYYRGETWNAIAVSDTVDTPPENLSESDRFDFATIPLHLSFSKLMENIQQGIQSGETLVSALSRLQRDGKLLPLQPSDFASLGSDERKVLETLLGREFLESYSGSSLSSHELQELIRKRLEERLNSEAGSEWLASWSGAGAESSLFGLLQHLAGPTSWSTAALSSWAAAALMSWAAAARGLSSWSGGPAAGAVSSSWGPQSLMSWLQAASSSWAQSTSSSLSQAALASWSQAVLTSWSQAALSSWSQAALSSWSSGETSSWSGQPFGKGEFFLNVSAELIFYGSTHPNASVSIDGKPVTLAADGTFRHHFIFPTGNDYEVPIVATSPNGSEVQRATLRFERETGKFGIVTDASLPPFSAAPLVRVA